MLLYIILLGFFISLYLICYSILSKLNANRNSVVIRLNKITKEDMSKEESELSKPLFTRIIKPLLDDMSQTVLKIAPKELVTAFENKVVMAGNPYNLSVRDWINLQVMIIITLPIITFVLGYYKKVELKNILLISLIEIGFGLILPRFILGKQAADRQKKIQNSLPDVIDLLTVSVEAGLGFDGALAKVIDKMPGPLAEEFDNVLQEMKVGKSKRDAMRDMTERVGMQDLTTFVGSIIQADQFGVGMGNVLRIQSEQMRQKRRQRAQEKGMKAPIKMLIPMVLFIFPTIFSVLLGPVIIKIIDAFSK
jgi:tight adherence protein C